MIEKIIGYLTGLPEEIVVLILAAMPISEVRGAIPVALTAYDFSIAKSFLIAALGNFSFVIPFLWFLNNLHTHLMKFKWYNKAFTWWSNRVRARSKQVEELEFIGLILFVGIPLPMTGAWSGCLAGFLLELKPHRIILACFIGIIIASTIVTIATVGLKGIVNLF